MRAGPVLEIGPRLPLDRSMIRLVTIKRPAEIERAGRLGQATGSRILLVVVCRSTGPVSRVAIKVPRRVGPAVIRNRFRRRVKEILRLLFPTLESTWDCVVIARPPVARMSFTDLRAELFRLLARAGVLRTLPSGPGGPVSSVPKPPVSSTKGAPACS